MKETKYVNVLNEDDPRRDGEGSLEFLQKTRLGMDADSILGDLSHYYTRMLGRRTLRTDTPFLYQALVYAIRDRLMERWNDTNIELERAGSRRAYYLSMEFLMGRLLNNALYSLGSEEASEQALAALGVELGQVEDAEHDAGLGNGGLGRLAACFLDSCATLGLPVVGYGLRYQYGMFRQRIVDGFQLEDPDPWLRDGFPWEIERVELARTDSLLAVARCALTDENGAVRHRWVDTQDVLAIPYDVPIPGYRNGVVNTLRLWSAEATDEFSLEDFNAGSYSRGGREQERGGKHFHGAVPQHRHREWPRVAPAPAVFSCLRQPAGRAGRSGSSRTAKTCPDLPQPIVFSSTTRTRQSPCRS